MADELNLNNDIPELSSRRDFIQKGIAILTTGAAVTSCQNPFTAGKEDVVPSGEMVKLLSVDGEVIEVDRAFIKPVPDLPSIPISEERKGIPGKKFVMVIDLAKCKNLKKCQEECNHAHHLHSNHNWIKVHSIQESESAAPFWMPTTCMHCDEPPCVKVCPVDATFKREDGIVLIDSDRCIGCRFCMAACPYSTRVFNWEEPDVLALAPEIANQHYSCEKSVPQKVGTVGKCDFCPDMARRGELPHCVTACPNGVFMFGDENEDTVNNGSETFRLSELLRDKAGYRLMEDLGTKPRVYYLPPVDRLFPYESGLPENENV